MGDFPSGPAFSPLTSGVLSSGGECGVWGGATPSAIAAINITANRAHYCPVRVPELITVYRMVCGTGAGTTGNFDLGIYDAVGNRLVSTGSTAKTTASVDRVVDITDTILVPGLYYLAFATDTSAEYVGYPIGATTAITRILGLRHEAAAFPLPATATFVDPPSLTFFPVIGAMLRSAA